MSQILQSLKSDLLDRRMLPILVLLGAALLGAVAYTVLGGNSGTGGSPVTSASAGLAPGVPPAQGPALPVQPAAANPHAAVAETTEGARYRHKEGSHDPFTPLPSPATKTQIAGKSETSPPPSTSSSSSTSESKSGSSTGSGGASTTPTQPTQPSKPAAPKKKPRPIYVVSVQFGLLPTIPGELAQLTAYENIKPHRQLPSASDPRLVYTGARSNGLEAVFALGREAILKGDGNCLPSTSQCEAITLAIGKSEELDYLEADGQSVAYELKVVGIAKQEGATATISRRHHRHHHHRHT